MNDKDTKLLVIPGQATKRLAKLNLAGVIKLLESDGWGDILAFDTFRVELVTVAPTPWNPSDHVWTDHDTSELLMSYEDNDIDLKVTILERAIETVARRHRFHPVEEYLNSIKWDTKERIKNWLSTYFGVRDNT